MSRPTRNKSDAPNRSGSPLLTGILLGMVFGVALAAGLAWYLMKSPSPFVSKDQAVRPATEIGKPDAEARPAASAAPAPAAQPATQAAAQPAPAALTGASEEAKPRFEFYKVLTDKPDAKSAAQPTAAKPAESKPAAPFPTTYLQVGSFATADSAESLKAKLAMKGVESSVQVVRSQDGAEWHRVRVGPFHSETEINGVRATLKQMGLEGTPTR